MSGFAVTIIIRFVSDLDMQVNQSICKVTLRGQHSHVHAEGWNRVLGAAKSTQEANGSPSAAWKKNREPIRSMEIIQMSIP